EVADRHRDPIAAGLRAKSRDHRFGEIDSVHRHAALREGEGDSPGTDAELERGPVAGEIGEEGDDGPGVGGAEQPSLEGSVSGRDLLAEVILGHARDSRRCAIIPSVTEDVSPDDLNAERLEKDWERALDKADEALHEGGQAHTIPPSEVASGTDQVREERRWLGRFRPALQRLFP